MSVFDCIAGTVAMAGGVGGVGGVGAEVRGAARMRGPVGAVAARLAAAHGGAVPRAHDWLTLTPRDRMPAPNHVAFPKPPKAPGNFINKQVNFLKKRNENGL